MLNSSFCNWVLLFISQIIPQSGLIMGPYFQHTIETTWQLILLEKRFILKLHVFVIWGISGGCRCQTGGRFTLVFCNWPKHPIFLQQEPPQTHTHTHTHTYTCHACHRHAHTVGGMKQGQLGPDATATMTPANYSTARQGCMIKSPSNWEKKSGEMGWGVVRDTEKD